MLWCAFTFFALAASSIRGQTTLAIFGDYGNGNPRSFRVAEMINDVHAPSQPWNVDYIFTTGDNTYGQIDVGHNDWNRLVGMHYGDFMLGRVNASGIYHSQRSSTQRFFPAVGNHDASPTGTGQDGSDGGLLPGYIDYFHTDPDAPEGRLPPGVHTQTQSYYDVELPIEDGAGTFHMFVLDSNAFRVNATSRAAQTAWLKDALQSSTATWKFVVVHHPPYNSTVRGNDYMLQLPYQQWGAHAVFAGHAHTYERIHVTDAIQNDFPYFVSGIGGQSPHPFRTTSVGSRAQMGGELSSSGAVRVRLTDHSAAFEFVSIDDGAEGANGGRIFDSFTLQQNELPLVPVDIRLVAPGAQWYYLDDGSDQGTIWKEFEFDPASAGWKNGFAQFGFGNSFETTVAGEGSVPPGGITNYFRRDFHLTTDQIEEIEKLTIGLVRDDGAAVYLNGVEIHRDNLPGNAAFNEPARLSVFGALEWQKFSADVAVGELLRVGKNVIAVEVHQASPTGDDFAFDLSLDGGRITFGDATVGATTGFEDSQLGSVASDRDPGETELAWGQQVVAGFGISEVRDQVAKRSSDPGDPVLSSRHFVVNNQRTTLISEPIDVRGFRNVQVSVDYGAYTVDESGFEDLDFVNFSVLNSSDGVRFTKSIWNAIRGGDDILINGEAVGTAEGATLNTVSPIGLIDDDVQTFQIAIESKNDSRNEYFLFDRIAIAGIHLADFLGDGDVDIRDLETILSGFGSQGENLYAQGDANSDGWIGGADALTWQRQFTGPSPSADFDANGVVDGNDLAIMQIDFGSTDGNFAVGGDSDNDGDVDGADFQFWQATYDGANSLHPQGGATAPEPRSLALCLAVLVAFAFQRRLLRRALSNET